MKKIDTSWETSSGWYDKIVGQRGHYYHQQLILPGVLRLLEMQKASEPHLLDLACGHGRHSVELARRGCAVTGVDLSEASLDRDRQPAARTHPGDAGWKDVLFSSRRRAASSGSFSTPGRRPRPGIASPACGRRITGYKAFRPTLNYSFSAKLIS